MKNESKWENISDQDFVAILLKHESDQSWTVSEIFELERRGFEILDDHPELQKALNAHRERLISRITKSIQPSLSAFRQIESNFEKLQQSAPKINFPKFPKVEVPTLYIQSITGPVKPKLGETKFIESSNNGSLEKLGIENLLKQIADATKSTSDQMKPGWPFWTLFGFSAISAICSILSIYL